MGCLRDHLTIGEQLKLDLSRPGSILRDCNEVVRIKTNHRLSLTWLRANELRLHRNPIVLPCDLLHCNSKTPWSFFSLCNQNSERTVIVYLAQLIK